MNTAKLELCKELYELSGHTWLGDGDHHHHPEYVAAPAYDLGYLLRKLDAVDDRDEPDDPGNLYVTLTYCKGFATAWMNRGITTIGEPQTVELPEVDADTPEDALCHLAIQLFKQGILIREAQR